MTALSDLAKPQFDAALSAARELLRGNPANACDRASYRAAKERLSAMLPEGEDAGAVILAAVRWNARNEIAAAFAGHQTPPSLTKERRGAGNSVPSDDA